MEKLYQLSGCCNALYDLVIHNKKYKLLCSDCGKDSKLKFVSVPPKNVRCPCCECEKEAECEIVHHNEN